MFANQFIHDQLSPQYCGFPPNTYATGSAAGVAIPLANFRKMAFWAQVGAVSSANCQVSYWLTAASTSAGTYTSVGSVLGPINGSVNSGSAGLVLLDTRNEKLADLAQNYSWVKLVQSVAGNSVTAAVLATAYDAKYVPASKYDSAGYVAAESDLY